MARGDREPLLEKGFLIVLGAVLLLTLALIPAAQRLDADVDGQRPLYDDVLAMAVLQYREVRDSGQPLPLTVGSEESVQVGGDTFTPADGITVEVRDDDPGYCVRAADEDGHETDWQCYDGREDPSPRGFDF